MPKMNRKISCDVESTRTYTPEGFLKVSILAGKVGVQRYRCNELEVPDLHGDGFVNVARLPEEVFSQQSLDSLEFIDITDNHPPEREVTADNYKARTTGVVISKGRKHDDGKHIVVDALVKDKATIRAIENNKREVSLGYRHEIERQSGELNGEPYDYVMTDISHNHLAVVHRGRAKTAIILDHEDEDNSMPLTEAEIKKLQDDLAKEKEKNLQLTNDAESSELEKTIDRAKIISPKFEPGSMNSEQVKRSILGNKVSNDHSMDVVNFAFNAAYNEAVSTASERKLAPHKISNDGDGEINHEPGSKTKHGILTTDGEMIIKSSSQSDPYIKVSAPSGEAAEERRRLANDADSARAEYLKELEEGYSHEND